MGGTSLIRGVLAAVGPDFRDCAAADADMLLRKAYREALARAVENSVRGPVDDLCSNSNRGFRWCFVRHITVWEALGADAVGAGASGDLRWVRWVHET